MMAKTPIYIINSLYLGPALGQIGCSLYGFVGGLTGTTSILTLAAIALDRYYAIVHPLNALRQTTSRRTAFLILSTWTYAAVFSTLPLFGINNYTSEGYLTSCSFDYLSENIQSRIFVFVFFLAAWFLPLVVIGYSYLSIFRIVRAAEKMDIFDADNSTRPTRVSFKIKQNWGKQKNNDVKLAILAGVLISLWIISWTPYALVALLGIFGGKSIVSPIASAVPALFCKTASCVNPFVYAINHPRFQRELRSLFSFCSRRQIFKQNVSREASYYSAATCRENGKTVACVSESGDSLCRDYSIKGTFPLTNFEGIQKANKNPNQSGTNEIPMKSSNKSIVNNKSQRHLPNQDKNTNPKVVFSPGSIENISAESNLSHQMVVERISM